MLPRLSLTKCDDQVSHLALSRVLPFWIRTPKTLKCGGREKIKAVSIGQAPEEADGGRLPTEFYVHKQQSVSSIINPFGERC